MAGTETPFEYVGLAGEDEDPLVVPAVVKGEDALAWVQLRHPTGTQNNVVAALEGNKESRKMYRNASNVRIVKRTSDVRFQGSRNMLAH